MDGEQGVAPKVEEIIVQADLFAAEQGPPDRRDGTFEFGARRHEFRADGEFGARQVLEPATVDFTARIERYRRHGEKSRWHHIIREFLGEPFTQLPDGNREALAEDDEGAQSHLPAVFAAGDHGRTGEVGVGGEDGFDLPGFDPVAADLDLVIEPAEVLERAIGGQADQVAGAVEAGGRVEWVQEEAFGREIGALTVAAGEADAAEPEFAGDADGLQRPAGVEDAGEAVGNGFADGGEERPVGGGIVEEAGGGDVGFGGTVMIPEAAIGEAVEESADGGADAELFAGDDEFPDFEGHGGGGRRHGEVLEHDRGNEEPVDVLSTDLGQEGMGVAAPGVLNQDKGPARKPGDEELREGDVEPETREL